MSLFARGMQQASQRLNQVAIRGLSGLFVNEKLPITTVRQRFSRLNMLASTHRDVSIEQQQVAGVPVEVITPDNAADRHIVYFHGGAFCLGEPKTHRDLTVWLAKSVGATVWVVDYRLAPEHPYPAAPDDCEEVYNGLLQQGVAPNQLALAGDSAGGNLVLVTMQRVRRAGAPLPAAAVLYSPWVDLRCTSESYYTQKDTDPMLTGPWLRRMREYYRNGEDVHHPELSPLLGDLAGMPPILLHVGSNEVLLNDALNLESAIRLVAGSIHLKVWESLWHVFHANVQYLEVARQAVLETRHFLHQSMAHNLKNQTA